ncbi:MAG: hypothetical protein U9N06_06435 [candidate division WOR-3 bacterium]|nr:hypothetical protein [candidate division WOR-3 bacterium]
MKRSAVLIILIVLLVFVEIKGFKWIPGVKGEELLFFPSGKFVQGITSGFDNLFADFIWIETGVYYGKHRMSDRSYHHLYHILEVLTDLDSRFIPAYTLGSMLLSDDAKRIDLGIKLLDKGLYKNPTYWEIPFTKGFIYYLYTKDYKEASKWFLISSYKEDSPEIALKFATWTLSLGKGVEVTLRLYLQFYNMSASKIFREKAIKGIMKVLRDQAMKFQRDKGYYPKSLSDMVERGYLPFIPKIDAGQFKIEEGKILYEQFD